MRATPPGTSRAAAPGARGATTSLVAALVIAGCGDLALTGPRDRALARDGAPHAAIAPRTLRPTTDAPSTMPIAAMRPDSAEAATAAEAAPEAVPATTASTTPAPAAAPAATPAAAPAAAPAIDLLASVDALSGRFGCLPDGAASGAWTVRFAGYGCAAVGRMGDETLLALRPAVAARAEATHAGLVLGPVASSLGAAIDVRARVLTTHQLRTGSAPNPWEVAWLVWHYTDDEHFYYFIPKPNGWELGKRDPAYPGGQRFLATGSAPRFPVGDWHDVVVTQRGATITVSANGRELVTFVDREAAYTRGNVGVYSEDAAIVARVN